MKRKGTEGKAWKKRRKRGKPLDQIIYLKGFFFFYFYIVSNPAVSLKIILLRTSGYLTISLDEVIHFGGKLCKSLKVLKVVKHYILQRFSLSSKNKQLKGLIKLTRQQEEAQTRCLS